MVFRIDDVFSTLDFFWVTSFYKPWLTRVEPIWTCISYILNRYAFCLQKFIKCSGTSIFVYFSPLLYGREFVSKRVISGHSAFKQTVVKGNFERLILYVQSFDAENIDWHQPKWGKGKLYGRRIFSSFFALNLHDVVRSTSVRKSL